MRTVSFLRLCVSVAAGLAAILPARADDACARITDSELALVKAPHTVSGVTTIGGSPSPQGEVVVTRDKIYTRDGGAWRSREYSVEETLKRVKEQQQLGAQQHRLCQKLDSEPVNGEPTSLLVVRTDNGQMINESLVWVSDKTGLPLKSEMHLTGGIVSASEYHYGDIKPPPGAE